MATRFLSPEQVCDLIPGMTKGNLAQRRYLNLEPRFSKLTYKTVVYREEDVMQWIERGTSNPRRAA